MRSLIVLFLVGCATGPASVRITGEETVTVHSLDAVTLPAAEALDASNAVMPEPGKWVWTVEPAEVAALSADGTKVELKGEGTVTVTAAIGDKKDSMTLKVALPDEVVIDASGASSLMVGGTGALKAVVKADGAEIANAAPTWTVSEAALATVAADGTVSMLQPGTVTVTATFGPASATVDLTAAPVVADGAEVVPPM
jgi:hypothetical protein